MIDENNFLTHFVLSFLTKFCSTNVHKKVTDVSKRYANFGNIYIFRSWIRKDYFHAKFQVSISYSSEINHPFSVHNKTIRTRVNILCKFITFCSLTIGKYMCVLEVAKYECGIFI